MNNRAILFFLAGIFFTFKFYAQKADWEAGMFAGFSVYQGDIAVQQFDIKEANPAIGFTARYKYYYTLNFRANLLLGRLDGDDRNSAARTNRGFRFETSLIELSGMVEWEPLGRSRELRGGKNNLKVSPYLLGGLGFCFTNPRPMFPSLGTPDSQNPVQQDMLTSYSKVHLILPVALGVRFDVSRDWLIGAEIGPRYPFTDYLDGISKAANPNAGDWYWFYGLTAMYKLR